MSVTFKSMEIADVYLANISKKERNAILNTIFLKKDAKQLIANNKDTLSLSINVEYNNRAKDDRAISTFVCIDVPGLYKKKHIGALILKRSIALRNELIKILNDERINIKYREEEIGKEDILCLLDIKMLEKCSQMQLSRAQCKCIINSLDNPNDGFSLFERIANNVASQDYDGYDGYDNDDYPAKIPEPFRECLIAKDLYFKDTIADENTPLYFLTEEERAYVEWISDFTGNPFDSKRVKPEIPTIIKKDISFSEIFNGIDEFELNVKF